MSASKKIKMIMLDKDIKTDKLSAFLGIPKQTIYNKFCRDTMKYNDVESIADFLGCDIVFKDRKTGKEY